MNYDFLGENIQKARKLRQLSQQQLADIIGINMQSLSKIERGVNYPSLETLEKITHVLDVTPNELLSGEWKNTTHIEKEILDFLKKEEHLNVELAHGQYDNYFDSWDEWQAYESKKLREYILEYLNSDETNTKDLYPIKQLVQHQKFQKLMERYDDYYCLDLCGETIKGYKNVVPYLYEPIEERTGINKHYEEDKEIMSKVPTIKGFEDSCE